MKMEADDSSLDKKEFLRRLGGIFFSPVVVEGNFIRDIGRSEHDAQQHTNEAFTEKWAKYGGSEEQERLYAFQRAWYLKLYGFPDEAALRSHLTQFEVIFDAGCGLGYKAAWLAELAPHALVVGMDFSDAARQAATAYSALPNLFFVQGDIAQTGFRDGAIGYASCDQVIMHTENPEATFAELSRITRRPGGEVACYFYAKKALPRELLDEHFRSACKQMGHDELWQMSEQLAELGRLLSDLNVVVDFPEIPALGIKGGRQDLQRFIYWNFVKCFWNAELGRETSIVTNFDWYSPANARRFGEEEVREIVARNGLRIASFHAEEACYSGRFSQ